MTPTPEHERLAEDARREKNWKRWGPYLSERQWSTVREDYSANSDSWRSFPHDHARSRAYRWGEDGLLGWTDRECRICFGLALWNHRDPILKERLFGLTGPEGNHGEDVKECYYYLDATPTYSYALAEYHYPQAEFPYQRLVEENGRRGYHDPEFELEDAGAFDEMRYFAVSAAYAKAGPNDLLIRVRIENRGPEAASIDVLPSLWFRNTWEWGCAHEGCTLKPSLSLESPECIKAEHLGVGDEAGRDLGIFRLHALTADGRGEAWFTQNETNRERLYGQENISPYTKDAFHRRLVDKDMDAVDPRQRGTKAAFHYSLEIGSGQAAVIELRLTHDSEADPNGPAHRFEEIFAERRAEADVFHKVLGPSPEAKPEEAKVARQARAGLLWSNQFFHYIVKDWLDGDPWQPKPPEARKHGRNHKWRHLYARDVLSMPDKWEYPWFAAWDSAFHMLPYARMDPSYAKDQLLLFLREWYLHPNGQIPAYEFKFDDVNPPVHAWSCRRVYEIEKEVTGKGDRLFLERVFQKLLLNFNWWVNRKDAEGENLFSGGFLGLDNIGVFDRSKPLPGGGRLEQADATAWMAFYCLNMLEIALELAIEPNGTRNTAYEDMASKFFEHYVQIVEAINHFGGNGLWNEEDGFFYDQIDRGHGDPIELKIRSLVGLLPLIAVFRLSKERIAPLTGFRRRLDWFLRYQPDLAKHIVGMENGDYFLAIAPEDRLSRVSDYLFSEGEFQAPFGIRSPSLHHRDAPFHFETQGQTLTVAYLPAESDSGLFGGNSNWRGPVWFPTSYLLLESLRRYADAYPGLKVGSSQTPLREAIAETARRLIGIFLPDQEGGRPCHGEVERYRNDPLCRERILFYEYFHPETGRGCGASHQTGWTSLVEELITGGFGA